MTPPLVVIVVSTGSLSLCFFLFIIFFICHLFHHSPPNWSQTKSWRRNFLPFFTIPPILLWLDIWCICLMTPIFFYITRCTGQHIVLSRNYWGILRSCAYLLWKKENFVWSFIEGILSDLILRESSIIERINTLLIGNFIALWVIYPWLLVKLVIQYPFINSFPPQIPVWNISIPLKCPYFAVSVANLLLNHSTNFCAQLLLQTWYLSWIIKWE